VIRKYSNLHKNYQKSFIGLQLYSPFTSRVLYDPWHSIRTTALITSKMDSGVRSWTVSRPIRSCQQKSCKRFEDHAQTSLRRGKCLEEVPWYTLRRQATRVTQTERIDHKNTKMIRDWGSGAPLRAAGKDVKGSFQTWRPVWVRKCTFGGTITGLTLMRAV